MARLGATVEVWTRVGEDDAGRFILDQFARDGVDTSQVQVCPGGRSPVCSVTVDLRQKERFFRYFPGRGLAGDPRRLALDRVDAAQAILVDGWWPEAQLQAARRARERGIPICADFEGLDERFTELVSQVDYPIYSQECAAKFGGTGSIEGDLRRLADLGGAVPMVTLGSEGCVWLEGGRVRRLPAFRVEVVDTTGCGDVFHGAFTFGLARGWEVERNARFASAAAALKCRALGGRTGIPRYDEVVAFLNAH